MEQIKKLKRLERKLICSYEDFNLYQMYAIYDNGAIKQTYTTSYTAEQNKDNCKRCLNLEKCKHRFDVNCKVVNNYKIK